MAINKKPYTVFVIQAHEGETPDMHLTDVVALELIDTSAGNAIERAKKLVSKKFYRLSAVIEKFHE